MDAFARWLTRHALSVVVASVAVTVVLGLYAAHIRIENSLESMPAGAGRRAGKPPNVLVVVIDTLRADRVGAYGGHRGLTPFLDDLATRGTVFERAYAASSWTMPSVASLVTSRFPSQHGVTSVKSNLPDGETTLGDALHEHGFVAGLFSANPTIARSRGFARGYERAEAWDLLPIAEATSHAVDGSGTFGRIAPRGDFVNRAALAWLDGRPPGAPIFLYLQYMETHHPFAPPRETVERLGRGRPYPDLSTVNGAVLAAPFYPITVDDALLDGIRDVYDAEVASVDAELRALFDGLAARGFLQHAVVVVTADHGEELRDHGSLGHGTTVYEELVHVPLIVLTPDGSRGRVADVVSLVDVAPTILDLLGIPAPPTFEGRSLAAELPGAGHARAAGATPPAYIELLGDGTPRGRRRERRAIVAGARKVIVGPDDARAFYDLATDPTEQHGLDEPPDAGALVLAVEQAAARARRNSATAASAPLDDVERAKLRALGYVQ